MNLDKTIPIKAQLISTKKWLNNNVLGVAPHPFKAGYQPWILGGLSGFSVFYFLYFFEAYSIQQGTSYSGPFVAV